MSASPSNEGTLGWILTTFPVTLSVGSGSSYFPSLFYILGAMDQPLAGYSRHPRVVMCVKNAGVERTTGHAASQGATEGLVLGAWE